MDYLLAANLPEALQLKRDTGFAVVAGGTDIFPAIENGLRYPGLLDVSRVGELAGPIRRKEDFFVIPAMSSWTALVEADLPPQFDAVKQAAVEIGGRQIQNTGTVAGNICNASPAADGVVALMALGARVTLAGSAGQRQMTLADFVLGNRKTALKADELLLEVCVPAAKGPCASVFRKVGARRYLVISIAMCAVSLELDAEGRVAQAGLAVGACGPRAVPMQALEARLKGESLDALSRLTVREEELSHLTPIDDVRASAAFRLAAAKTALEEGIQELATRMSHG